MEHRGKSRLRKGVASVVTATLLAAGAVVGASAPAQAAGHVEYGIGMGGEGGSQPHQLHGGGPNKNRSNWHGSYFVPGVGFMFCLNAGLGEGWSNDPGGETNSFYKDYWTNIGSIPNATHQIVNLGPSETFKINYAIQKFGQTGADWGNYSYDQALWGAATEMYIWSITNPNLTNGQTPWDFYHTRFDAGQQAEMGSRINQIAAAANAARPSSGDGAGSVAINMTNYHEGVAVVSMTPSDATATLTISGGTFPGGMTSIGGVTNGQSIPVYGNATVDPNNPHKQYSIRINGSAVATGEGITDKIRVASNGSKQDMVMPGANVSTTFDLSSGVSDPLIEFSPLVRTEAPEYIRVGQSFTDSVIASVADDIDSPWATFDDGSYVPVKAQGTLYGPLTTRPTESNTAPAGAPVAATSEVTLNGPGTYTATAGGASTQSGYYTWVWNIDSAKQGAIARMLLPQGYTYTDHYGQKVETTYAPMSPTATSQVESGVVTTGDKVRDTLTVSNAHGPWMDGAQALFEGTAYSVTNGDEPKRGGGVPNANARIISTVRMTVGGPGTYTSPEVTVPDDAGHVVWVWRFASWYQADKNLWAPNYRWSDEWAMPSETQRVRFSPAVTTEVSSEYVQPGDTFNDKVTAFAAKGQWTGKTSIRANGTLYGPFADRPAEADAAPAGAPVAGTAILALNGTGTYETNSGIVAKEAGYYTWVWSINASEQSDISKDYIPANYSFTDRFAQKIETSTTPMQVGGVSKVVDAEVALDQGFQDTLDVAVSQNSRNWIMVDGQRIPVTFRGTAYFVPGITAPAQSATVPAGAEVVGTTTITANSPGLHESEVLPGEDYREGYTTWVWEVRKEDQPAQYRDSILEWRDDFGIPDETTKVVLPKIATQAQTDVPVGDTFHDVATVTGPIPVGGADVHFELYSAKKDESGNWVCGAGNLLWTSSSQTITSEGSYTSPEAPYQSVGEYHWVEVLTSNGGHEISRGVCGIPEETTKVVAPEVTTKAQPASALGSPTGIFDVATVTGPIAKGGYDLTFEAYKVPTVKDETTGAWKVDAPEGTKEGDLSWVCNSAPVFTTEKNLHVSAAGDFTSQSFVPEEYGKYLWVETLTYNPAKAEDGKPIVIHRGECGVRLESSFVLDITTQAQQHAKGGESATDTAIVNGYIPEGSTIEFAAYKVPSDAPQFGTAGSEKVCTEAIALGTTEPVAIPEGQQEKLEIVSAGIPVPDTMNEDYKVYWIETARDSLGNVIAHGECGLPGETTLVQSSKAELAWTGGFAGSALFGGAAALLALFVASGVYVMRRRQEV